MTSGKKNDDVATPDPRRRLFLQGSIAGALIAAIPGCSEQTEEGDAGIDLEAASQAPTVTTQVVRALDMLVLTLHFVNFQRKGAKLVPVDPALPMLLVVELPPQHVFEEAFAETGTTKPSDPLPVKHRLSGKSRLSFVVPAGTKFLDFDLQKVLSRIESFDLALAKNATDGLSISKPIPPGIGGVLSGALGGLLGPAAGTALSGLAPSGDSPASLDAAALAAKAAAGAPAVSLPPEVVLPPSLVVPGKPVKPTSLQTAIELPFRLQISPGPKAAFAHDTAPVARGRMGRYELWHTRLGVRMKDRSIDESDRTAPSRTFRALWTRDDNAGIEPQSDFTFAAATLQAPDRRDIVTESADFTKKPRRVLARRLMLSSLGGYLDALGTFDGTSTGLLTWEHRAAMGRDNYVRTVRDGYLYPFGHRTVLVTVTERKFKPSNPRRAYLWQRQFLLVQEPVRAYGEPNDSIPGHAPLRQNPFRAIEITTLQTPDLDPTSVTSFCPRVDGLPFLFGMKAVDAGGNLVDLHAPVLWVPKVGMPDKSGLPEQYRSQAGEARNAQLRGQRVTFAPPAAGPGADDGGSSFETQAMSFVGAVGSAVAGPWAPVLERAEIAVPALRALSGAGTTAFAYAEQYLTSAFGVANQGEVLLGRVDEPGNGLVATFSQASDKVGGFVAPDLDVTALSRKVGPVSGTADAIGTFAKGDFDPETFFAGLASAKLFGMFPLMSVIDKAGLGAAPRFLADTANTALAFVRDAKALWDQAQTLATDLSAKAAAASGAAKARLSALQARVAAVVSAVAPFKDLAALDPATAALNLGKLETALAGLDVEVRATPELPEATRRFVASAFGKVHGLLAAGGSALTDLAALLALAQQGKELAENLTVKVAWTAPLRPAPPTDPIFKPSPDKPLKLSGELRAKATKGRPAGLDLTCALEDFKLDLVSKPSFIVLDFEHILFKTESGKKPEIDVKLRSLTFTGPLSFVNALKDVLPLDGFSDPPALDVSTQGIKASYSFPLPSVAVGIFSLANVSIGAALNVPFVGAEPLTVSFFFSTREHPFTLTVSALGGGGFFGITLSPEGVVSLEASIEFGASLALSFGGGAISGEITVMAGIYFKIVEKVVTLTGYLRLRGEVDVLGLISASIDLRMELSYESGTGKVVGRATLEIEVEVLFFSTTVSTSVERKFAGSNGDPTFRDVYGATYTPCLGQAQNIPMPCASAWDAYVGAFAD